MNVTSFVFEQALKQLGIPQNAIKQLQIAGKLSDVDGKGFPKELFALSAPMLTRGLLNYAILQMKSDWIYPHWVYKQLNPKDNAFLPRAQNPLHINITHRNWTMLGSPHGFHEAIVDPHGLVTPLPREWSVDVWLVVDNEILFPSFANPLSQDFNTKAPRITTKFIFKNILLEIDGFVNEIKNGRDVLFQSIKITNQENIIKDVNVCIAVRPFNPEGVAPISSIDYKSDKHIYVDKKIGLVFSETPKFVHCSNYELGDVANIIISKINNDSAIKNHITCNYGLANCAAVFKINAKPNIPTSLHYSIALGSSSEISSLNIKSSWRVSYEKRLEKNINEWRKERSIGASIIINDENLQNIFDANVLALLQLQDKKFISPGPFLYHHFWFRDAAPMLHVLDRLGFHKRTKQVIDAFIDLQDGNGFFKGPDGEWDSNGEALWTIEQHMKFTRSNSWLKNYYPYIKKAADWILSKKLLSINTPTTHAGLLPPSLSAEHFGTVNQYYWDSFWALAGIKSARNCSKILYHNNSADVYAAAFKTFVNSIKQSLEIVAERLGEPLIPASPTHAFDQTAIGFVCGIYPLQIEKYFDKTFKTTLDKFVNNFVDENGFYHPIVHSGYNAYLTMQLAHAYLSYNDSDNAWKIANTIINKCKTPYSFPEAINPKTGGGAMGDGHHGWAAAEIVSFILDTLVMEKDAGLYLLRYITPEIMRWHKHFAIKEMATSFGKLSFEVNYETNKKAVCKIELKNTHDVLPNFMEIKFPFKLNRIVPITNLNDSAFNYNDDFTIVRIKNASAVLLLEK